MSGGFDVLAPLLDEARVDPENLAVLLTGSRTSPLADESDDYDVYVVVTDAAFERVESRSDRNGKVGIVYLSLELLAEMAQVPGWWTYSLASAQVLLDKTGEVAPIVAACKTLPPAEAQQIVADVGEEYFRFFVRALRAAARGDRLGAQLHAAESLIRLARLLFAVARRPVPYHDRLCAELDTLSGWDSGYLRNVFTRIACDGDTDLQLDLEQRVELLLEENGIFVHRRWADRVRRFRDGDR